uniref:Uncharacterized protein n=1 Tax=Anguilla anguilla TaxID=7936 RepID=A0A0E9PJT3_ANGAN
MCTDAVGISPRAPRFGLTGGNMLLPASV